VVPALREAEAGANTSDVDVDHQLLGELAGGDSLPDVPISNSSSFRQKNLGVPDGSDGSDGTSYPLTENYTLPVAQATGRIA